MAGNTSSVWLDIIARDKATRTLAKVGAQTAAMAAAIKVFGIDSVKAYADAEVSQLKLQDAFSRFPKLADSSYKALTDYNNALQAKTRFDDDAIASSQAYLARLDLTGQQLKQITPLMLDYAAATGQTADEAASKLGKALLGNAKALKATGVNFVATGDRAKDFTALMDLLTEKMGGFAEREGKTTAGQLAILKNQFGDLQEGVGEALVPALESLVGTSTKVLGVFNKLPKPVKSSTVILVGLGATALYVVPKMLALKKQLDAMNISSVAMSRGAKAAKVAIAALAAGQITSAVTGDRAAESYDKLTKSTDELDRAVGNAFARGTMAEVGNVLSNLTTGLVGMQTQVEADTQALQKYDAEMARLASSGSMAAAQKMWDDLAKAAQSHGISISELKTRFPQFTAALQGPTGAMGEFADATGDASDEVDDLYSSLTKFNDTFIATEQATINARDALVNVKTALKESKGRFDLNTDAGRRAREAALQFAGAVDDQAQAMIDAKKPASEIAKLYDTQRQNLYNTLTQMGLTKAEAKRYADALLKIPRNLTTQAKFVVRASGDTWVWSSGIAGRGRPWKPSEVGVGAAGGIVTRPTLALIGEAGPEAVVPLSRTPGSSPLAGGVTINILGPVTDKVSAARWINDALAAGRRAGLAV